MLGYEDREIERVLERSAAAWTAGDLDAFMTSYENSPDTVYLTPTAVVTGYGAIRSMYAERFGNGGAGAMGALTMRLLRVVRLGGEHALVLGHYILQQDQSRGGQTAGPFSLVLHKSTAGWRIAADHTS